MIKLYFIEEKNREIEKLNHFVYSSIATDFNFQQVLTNHLEYLLERKKKESQLLIRMDTYIDNQCQNDSRTYLMEGEINELSREITLLIEALKGQFKELELKALKGNENDLDTLIANLQVKKNERN